MEVALTSGTSADTNKSHATVRVRHRPVNQRWRGDVPGPGACGEDNGREDLLGGFHFSNSVSWPSTAKWAILHHEVERQGAAFGLYIIRHCVCTDEAWTLYTYPVSAIGARVCWRRINLRISIIIVYLAACWSKRGLPRKCAILCVFY